MPTKTLSKIRTTLSCSMIARVIPFECGHGGLHISPQMTESEYVKPIGRHLHKQGYNLPTSVTIASRIGCSGQAASVLWSTRMSRTSSKQLFTSPLTAMGPANTLPPVRRTCAVIMVSLQPCIRSDYFSSCLHQVPFETFYNKPGPVQCYERRGKCVCNRNSLKLTISTAFGEIVPPRVIHASQTRLTVPVDNPRPLKRSYAMLGEVTIKLIQSDIN
jgi:hypothetical protein